MMVCKDRIAQFIDWLFKGTNFMAALDGIQLAADELKSVSSVVSSKLDSVAALVQSLKDQVASGGNVTQAEIDSVLSSIAEARAHADAANSKIDSVLA